MFSLLGSPKDFRDSPEFEFPFPFLDLTLRDLGLGLGLWTGTGPLCSLKLLKQKETRPFLGHFLKKGVFCFLKMFNSSKNFQNLKIGIKCLHMGHPLLFSPKNLFY